MVLQDYLDESAQRFPNATALRESTGHAISYSDLNDLSDSFCGVLRAGGIQAGDRVGVNLRKSIDAVIAIFGVLKAGAAYVPVDYSAPSSRRAYIFCDCSVKAVVLDEESVEQLASEFRACGEQPLLVAFGSEAGGEGMRRFLSQHHTPVSKGSFGRESFSDDSMAYILYTSGSTGNPKGVKLSQTNATSFVEWCYSTFAPKNTDCFSSHAPLHFDLSVFDLYLSIKCGATLLLIDDQTGKNPAKLAELISSAGVTIWYSAPSILSLIAQYGDLGSHEYNSLRIVLFAGEVFPITHLKTLTEFWDGQRLFNLYGPTETNVCTYFELPNPIPANRMTPFPIGKVCEHLEAKVVMETLEPAIRGEEGELCIHGPAVTAGYWGLEEQSRQAFLVDEDGRSWYRTGDIVFEDESADFIFVGRRDRMVKKQGNRIELGEIESCFYRHPEIAEVAVVSGLDADRGVVLTAHVVSRSGDRISQIKLRKFCSDYIPAYMIPDRFVSHDSLPKTSTDKIDYQSLSTTLN